MVQSVSVPFAPSSPRGDCLHRVEGRYSRFSQVRRHPFSPGAISRPLGVTNSCNPPAPFQFRNQGRGFGKDVAGTVYRPCCLALPYAMPWRFAVQLWRLPYTCPCICQCSLPTLDSRQTLRRCRAHPFGSSPARPVPGFRPPFRGLSVMPSRLSDASIAFHIPAPYAVLSPATLPSPLALFAVSPLGVALPGQWVALSPFCAVMSSVAVPRPGFRIAGHPADGEPPPRLPADFTATRRPGRRSTEHRGGNTASDENSIRKR